jgi:chromosome segregation ATPase
LLQTSLVIRADQAGYLLTLTIPPNAAPPVAKEFLDAVITKSQEQVKQLYAQTRAKPIEDATRALASSQQRYTRAADALRDLRDKLRASAGRADVSPQSISDALSKLEEEKQKLELDVMGKQARRDALDQQIAKQSQTIQKKVEDDAIATELQKAADAREQKVKFVQQQFKQGLATQADINDAVAAAADAQAKLLQRRHDAAAEAGGDALQAFNREAVTLSVDLSEAKARLKFVQDRLTHLAGASDDVDQLERARAQAQSAADEVDKRTKALHDLEEKIASLPPGELTVISSQNSATPPDNGGQSMFGGSGGRG